MNSSNVVRRGARQEQKQQRQCRQSPQKDPLLPLTTLQQQQQQRSQHHDNEKTDDKRRRRRKRQRDDPFCFTACKNIINNSNKCPCCPSFPSSSSSPEVSTYRSIMLVVSVIVTCVFLLTRIVETSSSLFRVLQPAANRSVASHRHPSTVRLDKLDRDGGLPPVVAPPVVFARMPDFGKLQITFPLIVDSSSSMYGANDDEEAAMIAAAAGIRQIMKDPWHFRNNLKQLLQQQHAEEKEAKGNKDEDDNDDVEPYYAFDDDYLRNPYQLWDDDARKDERQCRRVSWHRDININCNTFHESDLPRRMLDGLSKYLGGGSYRNVFALGMPETNNETVVLKECSYDKEHTFNFEDFEFMRMDGAIGAIVTNHPLFTETYGFCALGLLTQAMRLGDLDAIAVPKYERCEEKFQRQDVDDLHSRGAGAGNAKNPFQHMNNLNVTQKLEWSLQMAEAVAVLNNNEGGVIVHDDIQLPQFLLGTDGRLKLNDFNRAEIMLFDEENQEYCRYRNNPGSGDWRAPEEYHDYPLNEAIDVWSLGNNMYAVLTGLYPFYEECHSKPIQKRVMKGQTAKIHPRWKRRSPGEAALVDIIKQCWIYEPDDRITIGDLVLQLRKAVDDNRRLQNRAAVVPGANNH